jgi:hypothetical protein
MCKIKATKIKSNPTEDNNQYNTRHVQGKGNQNQINKQLKALRIFHQTPDLREQENAVWDKFRLGSLESFNPATQKIYQLLPTIIHTQSKGRQKLPLSYGQFDEHLVLIRKNKGLWRSESRKLQQQHSSKEIPRSKQQQDLTQSSTDRKKKILPWLITHGSSEPDHGKPKWRHLTKCLGCTPAALKTEALQNVSWGREKEIPRWRTRPGPELHWCAWAPIPWEKKWLDREAQWQNDSARVTESKKPTAKENGPAQIEQVKAVHAGIAAWREHKQEAKKIQQEYQSRRRLLSDRREELGSGLQNPRSGTGERKPETCQHNGNQRKQPGTGDFTRAVTHRAVVALGGHRLLHGKGKTR